MSFTQSEQRPVGLLAREVLDDHWRAADQAVRNHSIGPILVVPSNVLWGGTSRSGSWPPVACTSRRVDQARAQRREQRRERAQREIEQQAHDARVQREPTHPAAE